MPDPSERQLLADAIRGELLQAHHGVAELDEVTDRVLACIDGHPPVAGLLADLDETRDRLSDLEALARRAVDTLLDPHAHFVALAGLNAALPARDAA